MLLLKIWWSLIAKKNTDQDIDSGYLSDLYNFLQEHKDMSIILIHGTGNIGHWFVKKFWLSQETKYQLRKDLDEYFQKIDKIFPEFQRISIEDVINLKYHLSPKAKIICWWDITNEPKIISSDDAFASFLHNEDIKESYLLTDVDGVLDKNREIINQIDKQSFEDIHFWKKEWDVTGAMEQKIRKLFDHKTWGEKKIWIINGKKLENFHNIITKKEGIGTRIHTK
jgi:isopentenyl phosphate kinase